jgi:RimJ/RimL family protein N-acetyltransferase
MEHSITLRPFQQEDLARFRHWLTLPHVAKWYTEPEDWLYELEHRSDEFHWISHFIVEHGDLPIGFCQFYAYRLSGETWHGNLPVEGAYSVDYLIGETEYLKKGFGRQIVLALIARIREQTGATHIFVQPEAENVASCQTLLSAGFHFDSANRVYILDL